MNPLTALQRTRNTDMMARLVSLLLLFTPLLLGCGSEKQGTIPVQKVTGDAPEPAGPEPVLSGEGP